MKLEMLVHVVSRQKSLTVMIDKEATYLLSYFY